MIKIKQDYIAHISEEGKTQSVLEHLNNVASMAADFSVEELQPVNRLCGALHDVGKYSAAFQKHIRGETNGVEHAICGAKEVDTYCRDKSLIFLLQLCIAGHHTGIPDCGTKADPSDFSTLCGRLKRNTEDYSDYRLELPIEPIDDTFFHNYLVQGCESNEDLIEKYAFLVRYVFSCLTDADSMDTRMACGIPPGKSLRFDYHACIRDIDAALSCFRPTTPLQYARNRLQAQVFAHSNVNAEVFLMNMPTGSGKTLASMRYALSRIARSGGRLRRIIYVIPYNSIIDQTAEIFETLFGAHSDVLRHQSSFVYEEQEQFSEDERIAAKYACENWDAGIIITTAVQFFESLYGNRRNKLRKIHNLAESVIVFDEAHLMPREYLEPCLRGISYITRYLHSEALFLTATMPDFESLLKRYAFRDMKVENLVTDTADFACFQKCQYENLSKITEETLVESAASFATSLIVMNSKKGAANIYRQCSGEKYHLSTYMTAFDRVRTIVKIKQTIAELYRDYPDLSQVPPERRITVVSTSLIEAGVDLDFAAVFRELTGLDSVLQAGGRCNREGLRTDGRVFVFETETQKSLRPEQELTKGIFAQYGDISTPEAIRAYYDRLLNVEEGKFSMNSISKDCKKLNLIPFRTYSEHFRLIDGSRTVAVAVCRDEYSRSLFEQLRETGMVNARKARKYCCTVYLHEFEQLLQQHIVADYGSGIYFLTDPAYYDEETGIKMEGTDYII